MRKAEAEVEAALRPDDLAPEEPEPEPQPGPWAMPEREPTDLTAFVELPLFASMPTAMPSGNGARPEPPSAEAEPTTPEPSAVGSAGRDGSDAEETPPAEGKQLRLL